MCVACIFLVCMHRECKLVFVDAYLCTHARSHVHTLKSTRQEGGGCIHGCFSKTSSLSDEQMNRWNMGGRRWH
jgi:hypothetical protein